MAIKQYIDWLFITASTAEPDELYFILKVLRAESSKIYISFNQLVVEATAGYGLIPSMGVNNDDPA